MTITVITAPEPVVTFDEAKRHVRIDDDDEQVYVEGLISAAQGWIDGPAGWLGRAVGVQLLEYRVDEPCSPIVLLPFGPVLEVVEAWSGEDVVDVSGYTPGAPAFSFGMQATSGQPIRIRYWAGYGERDPEDADSWINSAPAPIKVAILMLVAQWYYVREAAGEAAATTVMPFAVDALLQPFRVYR